MRLSWRTGSTADPSPTRATTASPPLVDSDASSASSRVGGGEPSYASDDDDDRLWPMPRPMIAAFAACPLDLALTAAQEPKPWWKRAPEWADQEDEEGEWAPTAAPVKPARAGGREEPGPAA